MRDGFLKVAAAAPTIRVGEPDYNAKQILSLVKKAESTGVKLMVFPELCVSGYSCGDLFLQNALQHAVQDALLFLQKASLGIDLLFAVGAPLRKAEKLYNCSVFIQNGKILGIVPKTHLPNYNEFNESRWFVPAPDKNSFLLIGSQQVPFGTKLLFCCETLPLLKIACEICEDLWVPNPPSAFHAAAGATVLCNLSCSNEQIGKAAYRRSLCKTQSARLVCGYLYADAGMGESSTDLVFSGHHMLCENGTLLSEAAPFSGEMAVTDLDLQRLAHDRQRITSFFSADREEYETIFFSFKTEPTLLCRTFSATPFVPASSSKTENRCEEIFAMQAAGLATRLRHIGSSKVILGLSGGLDSALALIACVRALKLLQKPLHDITTVSMPCFGTTKRTKSNAQKLAEAYGTSFREIDISAAVLQHFSDIGQDPNNTDIAYENAQARERTQVLMDMANQLGAIVIGTGDLSELALGWATYNGDHMSMYALNASIPKTLVRHMVAYEAHHCGNDALESVLLDILDTPVSPELLPAKDGEIAQKTEETVGPYLLHDFFLYYVVRWAFSPAKIFRLACEVFGESFDPQTIKTWLHSFYRRFFSQQFKRSCLPDGPKVGSVSLSPRGDWRMPSDASAKIWLDEIESL